jgi:hypothetical protein
MVSLHEYWSSFREELIATSLILVVAVGGSFFILNRLISPPASTPTMTNDEAASQIAAAVKGHQEERVLGDEVTSAPQVTILPTQISTLSLSPTVNPYMSEVFYGNGGMYEYDQYKFGINSPRIVFDARDVSSRKFVVDIALTNKTVTTGLVSGLSATIIKDGTVIVPNAALSVSETKVIMPGQTIDFQAKLSLIEGTDVSVISFRPGNGAPAVEHVLRP